MIGNQVVEKIDIAVVLEHYGSGPVPMRHRWSNIRCPFHEDGSASASVNTTEGRFRCFACDINGDGLDIIQEQEGLDFAGAVEFTERVLGISGGTVLLGPSGKQRRRGLLEKPGDQSGQRTVFQARVRRKPLAGS